MYIIVIFINHNTTKSSKCRAMLCISAAYAVVWCPSVCPSVWVSVTFCILYSVETSKYILFFTIGYSHTVLVITHRTVWQYSDGDSSNADWVNKNRDSPPISGSRIDDCMVDYSQQFRP